MVEKCRISKVSLIVTGDLNLELLKKSRVFVF